MAIQLDALSLAVALHSRLKNPLDQSTPLDELIKNISYAFTNGTGANQANQHWHDQRTLAASTSEELDLAGGLTGPFGETITFTGIMMLLVSAALANTNNVLVGGASPNGWTGLFGNVSDIIGLHPGGMFLYVTRSGGGLPVVAGSGDLLRIANGSAGTSVTYDIVLIGTV